MNGRTIEEICNIENPHNFYPDTRLIRRKIIFHAGPPNSGKTYNALKSFYASASGTYCCPLRLLANEVFAQSNKLGIPCDLVTGEEVKFADGRGKTEAKHVACTVQMTHLKMFYQVAIIDEMQMIEDVQNGWAWTRALLGLQAKEVHVCGEAAAINIVNRLAEKTGDDFEVRHYNRLTPEVQILGQGLGTFDMVLPGDCIVCFRRKDIHYVVKQLKRAGHRSPAVIYGALPPKTKRLQAEEFNMQTGSKNVLVSTDAIGMGLNLSIKRIIFYSLNKMTQNISGTRNTASLTPSHTQHIAGRAGRFASPYTQGQVTTFRTSDLMLLRSLMATPVQAIRRAGIIPSVHLLEKLNKHLQCSFTRLTAEFRRLCRYDTSQYFLCYQGDMTTSDSLLIGCDLPMEVRYSFCSAPLPGNSFRLKETLRSFAQSYETKSPVTSDKIKTMIGWPKSMPYSLNQLEELESASDVCSLYLWLGNKFQEIFPDIEKVEELQNELSSFINSGVGQLGSLA